MTTISAAGLTEFGGPEVLHIIDVPMPEPGPDEVVVRVEAATVNNTDLLLRSGKQQAAMTGLAPPYIPGMEFAGRIHAVGASTVLRTGQLVMGVLDPRRPQGGAYTNYLQVDAASVTPVVGDITAVEAATVPMNGLTAKMGLEALDLAPGQVVLVTGGAGAVGGYAIQLAKRAGLHVVVDSRPDDRELLLELGADDIVDREVDLVAAVKALHPQGVDGVINGANLGASVTDALKDGGAIALFRGADPEISDRVVVHTIAVASQARNTPALAWLAARVDDGTLTPRVAQEYALHEAAQAHERLGAGKLRGRLVLVTG